MTSKFPLILIFTILLAGCQKESPSSSKSFGFASDDYDQALMVEEAEQIPRTSEHPAAPVPPDQDTPIGEKIIKNGSIEMEVDDIQESKKKVDELLTRFKSYYENEQFHSYRNQNRYSLQIRIPNKEFESLVSTLENGIGEIKMKNVQANDVTEEYVDLTIRLENAESFLMQYKEILKKAKTIKETLEVKEIIRRTAADIESKKGRLKYLDDRVKYSSLHVELRETLDLHYSDSPSFTKRIVSAFKSGFEFFQSFMVAIVSLWPFLLVLFLIFFFRRRIISLFSRIKG